MKRIVLLFALVGLVLTSCKKDEPGGTASEKLAGEWWIKAEIETSPGSGVFEPEDPDMEYYFKMLTYNSSANKSNELYIDNMRNDYINDAYDYAQFKVKLEQATPDAFALAPATPKRYSNQNGGPDVYWVEISKGQIYPGAGKSVTGLKTDSICFYLRHELDPDVLVRISGHRVTGFDDDNDWYTYW